MMKWVGDCVFEQYAEKIGQLMLADLGRLACEFSHCHRVEVNLMSAGQEGEVFYNYVFVCHNRFIRHLLISPPNSLSFNHGDEIHKRT